MIALSYYLRRSPVVTDRRVVVRDLDLIRGVVHSIRQIADDRGSVDDPVPVRNSGRHGKDQRAVRGVDQEIDHDAVRRRRLAPISANANFWRCLRFVIDSVWSRCRCHALEMPS